MVCRGPGSNPVPPDLGADTLPTELPRPVNIVLIEGNRMIAGITPNQLFRNHKDTDQLYNKKAASFDFGFVLPINIFFMIWIVFFGSGNLYIESYIIMI